MTANDADDDADPPAEGTDRADPETPAERANRVETAHDDAGGAIDHDPADGNADGTDGTIDVDHDPDRGDVDDDPDGVAAELLAGAGEGILFVRADGTVARANAVAADLLGVDRSALLGARIGTVVPAAVEDRLPAALSDGGPAEPIEFEEYYPDREAWLSARLVPVSGGDGTGVYLREVTGRRERERTLSAREAEFATVDRVNRLVGDLVASLVDRTDRERIETTVCERLAGSDLLEFAWLAEPTLDGRGLRERVTAGPGEGIVDALLAAGEDVDAGVGGGAAASDAAGAGGGSGSESAAAGNDPTDGGGDDDGSGGIDGGAAADELAREAATPAAGIERAALSAGEVRVARDLAADRRLPAAARRVAFERGTQSALAVPVGYGDTTYGVLGVYTARPEAFGARERAAFATLGEVLGLAINAAKQRRLLLSDTTVEFDVTFDSEDAPLAALSERLDCRFAGAGAVPVDGGSVIQFLTVEGADAATVLDRLREGEGPSLATGRVVEGSDGSSSDLLSLRLSGASPLVWLVAHGATLRSVAVEHGEVRVSASVAPAESRDLFAALSEAFPGVTLTGKRESDRDVRTAGAFRTTVRSRLTDRQFEALRTGYLAGYFDWPRRSTAEEVADTMGISSATLHGHFRKSLRELLDVFLDTDG